MCEITWPHWSFAQGVILFYILVQVLVDGDAESWETRNDLVSYIYIYILCNLYFSSSFTVGSSSTSSLYKRLRHQNIHLCNLWRGKMEGIFHMLEECPTTRNAVLLIGFLYLLWLAVSLIRLLWSGTKAFILSSLFRVRIKPSSYGWAGKRLFLVRQIAL